MNTHTHTHTHTLLQVKGERGSYQGEGRVEHSDEDVSQSQVHDEQAGGGLGALVLHHHMAHQSVSEQRHHDDQGVRGHQQRLHAPVLRLPAAALPIGQRTPVLQHPLVKVQEEEPGGPVIQLPRHVQ